MFRQAFFAKNVLQRCARALTAQRRATGSGLNTLDVSAHLISSSPISRRRRAAAASAAPPSPSPGGSS